MPDTRNSVDLKDFIRVTVKERSTIKTKEDAAKALGYKTVESFTQALKTKRERYPKVFEGVPAYPVKQGPHVASEDEALALLAELNAPEEGDKKADE